MADLDQVKGINARQIKLLQENGISTAEALAMSPHSTVACIDGLGDKTAKKLIWNARNALGMTDFTPAAKIDDNVEYITTGSAELNRILGGGFQTGKLTEVYGPFKSGKTALAHSISVTVQLPEKKGGLNGAVAYIDTENTFSKEKIKRIAKRFELNPNDVLSKIYHARIYSSDHQSQMIQKAETLCKTRGVRLIVIDSLMALLRSEYVGIGKLAPRQAVLNHMIHGLSRIAETYNCAVLLTNQVATKMMGMFSSNDAIGGNIVAHGCHFRVMFKTKGFSSNNSLKRRAVIVDAPDLPPEECEFFITGTGVADTDKVDLPESSGLDFKIETLYEEDDTQKDQDTEELSNDEVPLTQVKGIGVGTVENLHAQGISNISELLAADPEELSASISGASVKTISQWQVNAKLLKNS
ncbi:MAG: DNA repair and recombination protein RadA [Candidatus Lokiarchaeota archaeon]|nr:DNA repair and recombination protein RadA [Candidatus Lokiarchaeota archaeon]